MSESLAAHRAFDREVATFGVRLMAILRQAQADFDVALANAITCQKAARRQPAAADDGEFQ